MNESQVFTNALKLGTPAERAAYLDEACAGNPVLRGAVDGLLRAHASDPDFLEQPAASLGGTVDVPPPSGSPGEGLADLGVTEKPGVVLAGPSPLTCSLATVPACPATLRFSTKSVISGVSSRSTDRRC